MIQSIPITGRDRERFEQFYIPEPNSGCWIWFGATNSGGYGNFSLHGRATRANRAAWLIYKGDLLAADLVCHSCDFPPCVNPDHLFIGTPTTNVWDCMAKGRHRCGRGEAHGQAKLTDDAARAIMLDARSHSEIAKSFSIATSIVSLIKSGRRWRHATGGVTDRRSLPRGEDNHKAKVTEAGVIAIRSDPRDASLVAADYGITRQQVHRIRQRESWSHVR